MMLDAIDELVARSKEDKELRAFHKLHRANPELLDFLVLEIQARIEHGFPSFAYRSLWEYCRWKLELRKGPGVTFLMNDHAVPFYARAIAILHPEFNGRAELRKSKADDVLGLSFEPDDATRPQGYARRLVWADGKPLDRGWRPTVPHVPQLPKNLKPDVHARPALMEEKC